MHILGYVFRNPNEKVLSFYKGLNTPIEIINFEHKSTQIRYIISDNAPSPKATIVFIHGAPGSSADFKSYLADYELKANYRMITLDRPGYGYSNYGQSMPKITDQAEAIYKLIAQNNWQNIFLVGHSFGGPIAANIAMRHPDKVAGVIMAAPLIDPDAEPVAWYAHLANLKLVRWMLPAYINVATDEKMAHAQELFDIAPKWSNIKVPVLHIHGTRDGLAPFQENIDFSKNNIPDSLRYINAQKDFGHLFIWQQSASLKAWIEEFIKATNEKNNL